MTTPMASRPDSGRQPMPESGSRPSTRPHGGNGSRRLGQLAWASVPIWSLSLLAFVPFLRLALVRQRIRDWAVFAGYLAASVTVVLLLSVPVTDSTVSDTAGALAITLAIALMAVGAVHSFVAFRPAIADSGALASEQALATARTQMHRRQQARELANHNPVLARDLKIGRPDMPHDYDDGGLVDVNHVPLGVLASCLGLTPAESTAVIEARNQLGRFSSPEELSVYAQLPPDRIQALRDWMMFG